MSRLYLAFFYLAQLAVETKIDKISDCLNKFQIQINGHTSLGSNHLIFMGRWSEGDFLRKEKNQKWASY